MLMLSVTLVGLTNSVNDAKLNVPSLKQRIGGFMECIETYVVIQQQVQKIRK